MRTPEPERNTPSSAAIDDRRWLGDRWAYSRVILMRHNNRSGHDHIQRRTLFVAALGFADIQWRGYRPAAAALERYLHSWRGLGDVVVGMTRQGFNVELRHLGDQWRATFYQRGLAHSIVYGTESEAARWQTVRRAA